MPPPTEPVELFVRAIWSPVVPDKVSTPCGTLRSLPVAPEIVRVLVPDGTVAALSVGSVGPNNRSAAIVCDGTSLIVGALVTALSIISTSAGSGVVRVGDQFAGTCQSALARLFVQV